MLTTCYQTLATQTKHRQARTARDRIPHTDVLVNPNSPCYVVLPSKLSCRAALSVSAGDSLVGLRCC